ncbi:colorectal mutant cancer protein isoform X1 [Eupeodes corollae]|uniref:colorectal mutant cancer protein isoform X1 n=1 Tax=Eupeodes corollae TaxID=290404 RepID=UPI00249193B2|nr:colorectal mutant cancer protein isoform X1 [Eupeodes corollae]
MEMCANIGAGGGGVGSGNGKVNNPPKCMVISNLSSGDHNQEVFKNFKDHGYIFGSTSPRGMSTSDYMGGGGVVADSRGFLQKDNNESDNNISSCSTLDIVNKVENLSILELETQLKELSQKLQKSEKCRDDYKRKLDEATEDKERCYRRLEVISAAHESRITEMHCVIAELSKKLRAKQENTIMEENEPDGSEISYQEGSVYNSELNLTNPDAECQTDPLDAEYSIDEDQKILNDAVAKTQLEDLQEEVLHLKAQIALLQSQIANPPQSNTLVHGDPELDDNQDGFVSYNNEHDKASDDNFKRRSIKKLNTSIYDNEFYKTEDDENDYHSKDMLAAINNLHSKELYMESLDDRNLCLGKSSSNTKYVPANNAFVEREKYQRQIKNTSSDAPIPKMAERVKLRKTNDDQNITATDFIKTGINNTEIVEHLVSDLIQSNNMMDSFIEASQLDTEFQRLQRRIEHLKVRNSVLALTLEECKEHCDHLYLLCGKYESNAIALQSAVNCSDRAIEAYDVMLALLESKMALLKESSTAAEDSRRSVEAVARHLLDRLESEKNLCENSLGPWQNTFCISDKPFEPWTPDDDNRLRNHVSKLKGRRSTVQNTIVNLESPFSTFYEKSRMALESSKEVKQEKGTQLDLEMAVLMQEMLNLREENIGLKQRRDEADRERQTALEKICVLQEAFQQLQTQLSDSDALFNLHAADRSSFSEADHAALTERQLVEALTRESELKIRIQSLLGSVSATQKNSDEKYEQVQNNIKELQKMNLNLSHSLEQTKRKYQLKIRKLEQKILEMSIELGQNQRMITHDNVPETTL